MNPLDAIGARVSTATRALVCIDGPAGAGKTTLAEQLAERFPGTAIVHMDDLYDGWDAAFSPALTQRLIEHIRDPFLAGNTIRHPRYDWIAGAFADVVELEHTGMLIVEGVGAAQRVMREAATVSVFLDVDPAIGRARVVERDGDASADHIAAWQTHEQEHFLLDGTRESVHLVLPHLSSA